MKMANRKWFLLFALLICMALAVVLVNPTTPSTLSPANPLETGTAPAVGGYILERIHNEDSSYTLILYQPDGKPVVKAVVGTERQFEWLHEQELAVRPWQSPSKDGYSVELVRSGAGYTVILYQPGGEAIAQILATGGAYQFEWLHEKELTVVEVEDGE
jgi:hypothetical protein